MPTSPANGVYPFDWLDGIKHNLMVAKFKSSSQDHQISLCSSSNFDFGQWDGVNTRIHVCEDLNFQFDVRIDVGEWPNICFK